MEGEERPSENEILWLLWDLMASGSAYLASRLDTSRKR
jgi:hypothetical protein